MAEGVAVEQLPETRRKVLELLKRQGPMTAAQLGKALGITSMGVRQHLVALERDGLIEFSRKQGSMGRPSYVYALTSQGDEVFPRSYWQLAHSVLEAAEASFGQEGLRTLFKQRNKALQAGYRTRLEGRDLAGKVAELAAIRSEEGYMANWESLDEDTFHLIERNCAICQFAEQCRQACESELQLFKAMLPEAGVKRTQHIVSGDLNCTYVIKRKKA